MYVLTCPPFSPLACRPSWPTPVPSSGAKAPSSSWSLYGNCGDFFIYCISLQNGHKTKTFENCHQHHHHDHYHRQHWPSKGIRSLTWKTFLLPHVSCRHHVRDISFTILSLCYKILTNLMFEKAQKHLISDILQFTSKYRKRLFKNIFLTSTQVHNTG